MTKILIFSIGSGGELGAWERQLGNAAILVPTIKLLKQHVPDVVVMTSIPVTDAFCAEHGISRIPSRKRYLPRFNFVLELAFVLLGVVKASLWRSLKHTVRIDAKTLIRDDRISRFAEADVVLDLNGDIFPSDTSALAIVRHTLEIMTISMLGKPVVEFASSPGPFKARFRRAMAKLMYSNIDLFLNREPVSSELLKQINIRKPILTTACPAFLLEPSPPDRGEEILAGEGVDLTARPLVGMTLAGYNLTHRTWGKRQDFGGIGLFEPMLKWLLDDLKATVFLLPHVYRINPYVNEYELINGPDHDILLNLFRSVDGERYRGRLRLIEGKYTPSEAKAAIGQCDMFISGRLHAGVAALSQGVPTVLLAYGHKHQGFARLVGQEKYAYRGQDSQELKALVAEAWETREEIASVLKDRMARVTELVHLNFEIIKELGDLDKSGGGHITEQMLSGWLDRSGQLQP